MESAQRRHSWLQSRFWPRRFALRPKSGKNSAIPWIRAVISVGNQYGPISVKPAPQQVVVTAVLHSIGPEYWSQSGNRSTSSPICSSKQPPIRPIDYGRLFLPTPASFAFRAPGLWAEGLHGDAWCWRVRPHHRDIAMPTCVKTLNRSVTLPIFAMGT
jgi:hypothetical protein